MDLSDPHPVPPCAAGAVGGPAPGSHSDAGAGATGSRTTNLNINVNPTATRPPPPSSPTKCAICLGDLVNRCYTNSCLHQFCFPCLHEWSKVKPECPLCKSHFQTIYHNIRTNDEFDEYRVPVLNLPPSISNLSIRDQFGTTFSLESNNGHYPMPFPAHTHHMHIFRDSPSSGFGAPYHHDHGYSFHRLVREHTHAYQPRNNPTADFFRLYPHQPRHVPSSHMTTPAGFENLENPFHNGEEPETFGSLLDHFHTPRANVIGYQSRRRIYDRQQFVEPFSRTLPPGTVFFPSVDYFQSHPRSGRRVKDWLYREILVLCSLKRSRTEMAHLFDTIISMLFRFDIRSAEFRTIVQPYFLARTRHFQHEFYHFVLSGMGLAEYDLTATYNQERPEDRSLRLSRNQETAATTSRSNIRFEPEVVTIDDDESEDEDVNVENQNQDDEEEDDDDDVSVVDPITSSASTALETQNQSSGTTASNSRPTTSINNQERGTRATEMREVWGPTLSPSPWLDHNNSPPTTQRPSISLTSIYTLSGLSGPVDIMEERYVNITPPLALTSSQREQRSPPRYIRVPFSTTVPHGPDYRNRRAHALSSYPFGNELGPVTTAPTPLWDDIYSRTSAPNHNHPSSFSSHADPVTNADYSRRHTCRNWTNSAGNESMANLLDWSDPQYSFETRLPPPTHMSTYRRTPPASPPSAFNRIASPFSVSSGNHQHNDSDSDEIELLGSFPIEKKPPLATITISSSDDEEENKKKVKVENTNINRAKSPSIDDEFLRYNGPTMTSIISDPQPSTSRGIAVSVNSKSLKSSRSSRKRITMKNTRKRKGKDEEQCPRKKLKTVTAAPPKQHRRSNRTTAQKVYTIDSDTSSECLDLTLQMESSSSDESSSKVDSSSDSYLQVGLEPISSASGDEKLTTPNAIPKIKIVKKRKKKRVSALTSKMLFSTSSSSSSSDSSNSDQDEDQGGSSHVSYMCHNVLDLTTSNNHKN